MPYGQGVVKISHPATFLTGVSLKIRKLPQKVLSYIQSPSSELLTKPIKTINNYLVTIKNT